MLRCPSDGTALVTDATHAVAFAACPRCAGVWFAREALEHHTSQPVPIPLASRQPRPRAEGGPAQPRQPRPCATCTTRLTTLRVEGIEIDRCDGCGGVWLDAGEYDAIRAHLAPVRTLRHGGTGGTVVSVAPRSRIYQKGVEIGLEAGAEITLRAVFWAVTTLLD